MSCFNSPLPKTGGPRLRERGRESERERESDRQTDRARERERERQREREREGERERLVWFVFDKLKQMIRKGQLEKRHAYSKRKV